MYVAITYNPRRTYNISGDKSHNLLFDWYEVILEKKEWLLSTFVKQATERQVSLFAIKAKIILISKP